MFPLMTAFDWFRSEESVIVRPLILLLFLLVFHFSAGMVDSIFENVLMIIVRN